MQTVSFRIEETKKDRIDMLASLRDRDRSYIINEALDTYLDLMDWQRRHIEEGARQADEENFAGDNEVAAAFSKWKS
ncbi:MAG: ribbon-helix-helix domain-containing protein [Synergistaceae bacterium]|nr:ribbon-helix-helix domain-containing protein [Synergistaceae bacterium]